VAGALSAPAASSREFGGLLAKSEAAKSLLRRSFRIDKGMLTEKPEKPIPGRIPS